MHVIYFHEYLCFVLRLIWSLEREILAQRHWTLVGAKYYRFLIWNYSLCSSVVPWIHTFPPLLKWLGFDLNDIRTLFTHTAHFVCEWLCLWWFCCVHGLISFVTRHRDIIPYGVSFESLSKCWKNFTTFVRKVSFYMAVKYAAISTTVCLEC
jgi:hypothetical protein